MSNLIKSTFVTFTPDNKRIIKVDQNDPKIINPNFAIEENEEEQKELNESNKDINHIKKEAQQIIEDAKKEAEQIIEDAKKEAELMKLNIIEQSKKEGYTLGYQEGYNNGEQEFEKLKQEIKLKAQKNEQEYQECLQQLEPQFVQLVIKLIEKITGILIEDKKEIIMYLMNQGIMSTESARHYIIHVSDKDYQNVLKLQDSIYGKNNPNIKIDIISDIHMGKGQCIIETDNGNINCSINSMLLELVTDLKILAQI